MLDQSCINESGQLDVSTLDQPDLADGVVKLAEQLVIAKVNFPLVIIHQVLE